MIDTIRPSVVIFFYIFKRGVRWTNSSPSRLSDFCPLTPGFVCIIQFSSVFLVGLGAISRGTFCLRTLSEHLFLNFFSCLGAISRGNCFIWEHQLNTSFLIFSRVEGGYAALTQRTRPPPCRTSQQHQMGANRDRHRF